MTFESFENIFALFCTIIGLLYCLFKYIEVPKRTCLYLVVFFLSRFLSDYFWTVYVFVMGTVPEVSDFAAYLGWNICYLFLFLAAFHLRRERGGRYFHPVMLWPVLTNVPLFILYIQFGGILNNLWEVGLTTLTMIVCTGELLRDRHLTKKDAHFCYLSALILVFVILEYGKWTASCFTWKSELTSPYLYCTILSSVTSIFFAWGIGKEYETEAVMRKKNESELQFQASIQTILFFVIFTVCIGGYFVASWIREFLENAYRNTDPSKQVVFILFLISAVLILIILFLLYKVTSYYRLEEKRQHEKNLVSHSKFNLVFTVAFTLVLMTFALIYNTKNYYDVSVAGVFEDVDNKVDMTATELENYLTVAETTLRVTADTVDMMEQNGASSQEILRYLTDQTKKQKDQFDENYTGIYAYINGEYIDGSGWDPPYGFDPVSREWYKSAIKADGKVVIVSPYSDAQTGSVVITIAKDISSGNNSSSQVSHNVVCLDVLVDHIREVTQQVDVADMGYGMVVDPDGFIIAHRNVEYNGKNLSDIYGEELLSKISETGDGSFAGILDGEKCTVFVCPIMDQWFDVIVVSNAECFENVWPQLVINIMVSVIAFGLLSFFYFLGYKNEQAYGRKVEEMNIQVVSALAAAIDAKDTYTNGHSSRVAEYSRMIVRRLGYPESKQDELYMIGLLHDVGKIGVPVEVINKPARLTDEEFEMIKKHPVIGSEILGRIKERPKLSIGARWHHERFGGGGYPDGLVGEEIPEEARIIAVADAYDAMTSRRSYRSVIPQEKVRDEIEKGMGTQFDPKFAKIMLQMIDEDEDYSMREK